MEKILVICGPTASGKTSIGVKLAKKLNGEIVSADSRQVYIGMDIATGKDLPVNSKFKIQNAKLGLNENKYQVGYYLFDGIPVWMLDLAKPNQDFSAADYVGIAEKVIDDILSRGKLPIIVGGTGFYIKALIDGIDTLGVPPDWALRKRLSEKTTEELYEMLARLNSEKAAGMNISDRKNPRRLIRAIEVILNKDKVGVKVAHKKYDVFFIGLSSEYKFLYDRIDRRVDEHVKMGAVKEIENLLSKGYSWNLPSMTAMGYGVLQPFFEGKVKEDEVVAHWKFEEHNYVRRQMTWFKKDKRINWFDVSEINCYPKVEERVDTWYNLK